MISQETKKRIRDQSQLPTHDDCEAAKKSKQLNALERFIYDQEPVDDDEWRDELKAAIIEAREAEATRAQGLVDALEKISDYTDEIFLVDPLNQAVLAIRKELEAALTNYNNPK